MSTEARFVEYVNIANEAIEARRDEFPYDALIRMAERLYQGQDIGIAVYDEDPEAPHARFTVRFAQGELSIVELGRTDEEVTEWKMPEAHLNEVVSHASAYRKNPLRFDANWLMERTGLGRGVQERLEAWRS